MESNMSNKKLVELNSTLEQMVREEVAKNREKDIMLIQQNRHAALGETLEHIAHQWKQPLNSISLLIQGLGETYSCNALTDDYVSGTVDKTMGLLGHMAQTIDLFRDFFRHEKEKSVFCIQDSISKALAFIEPALEFNGIKVELDIEPGLYGIGYQNEYAQVVLNILTNAKDAFTERKNKDRLVEVKGFREGSLAVVTIADTAGGISAESLDRIFDLYFTTRRSSGGTGIGLYLSKKIIENHMEGTLMAVNTDHGARFRIEIPGL